MEWMVFYFLFMLCVISCLLRMLNGAKVSLGTNRFQEKSDGIDKLFYFQRGAVLTIYIIELLVLFI